MGFHFVFAGIVSLTLNTIEVPPHKVVGDKAVLICQFDMEGDTLYSVKWYKDDREFYRFVPNDRPRLQVFDTEGIQVDVSIMLTYYNWDQKYFSGHHISTFKDISKVFLRKPHKECNLVPECDMKNEHECEIKDIVVLVQV